MISDVVMIESRQSKRFDDVEFAIADVEVLVAVRHRLAFTEGIRLVELGTTCFLYHSVGQHHLEALLALHVVVNCLEDGVCIQPLVNVDQFDEMIHRLHDRIGSTQTLVQWGASARAGIERITAQPKITLWNVFPIFHTMTTVLLSFHFTTQPTLAASVNRRRLPTAFFTPTSFASGLRSPPVQPSHCLRIYVHGFNEFVELVP